MPATTRVNTFTQFAKMVREAVLKTYGSNTIGFVAAYPKGEQSFPLITYKLINSKPSRFGRDQEIKPRYRETQKTQLGATEIWAKRIDCIVQFDIWAADGQAADDIVESFEDLMDQYIGEFKKAGVVEIVWLGQQNDKQTKEWAAELINRTVTYLVVLEKQTVISYTNINSVQITAEIGDEDPNEHITNIQGG